MLRRLALRLAFLAQEDRDWLLGQLPVSDRKRIDLLIREAGEMGLTKDPSILSSMPVVSVANKGRDDELTKEELAELSLFWQHLIHAHQDDNKAKLPEALMRSVVGHIKASLVKNTENN